MLGEGEQSFKGVTELWSGVTHKARSSTNVPQSENMIEIL
jgi:hypothetical protein